MSVLAVQYAFYEAQLNNALLNIAYGTIEARLATPLDALQGDVKDIPPPQISAVCCPRQTRFHRHPQSAGPPVVVFLLG